MEKCEFGTLKSRELAFMNMFANTGEFLEIPGSDWQGPWPLGRVRNGALTGTPQGTNIG